MPGIKPGAFHMQSERSTWATSLSWKIGLLKNIIYIYLLSHTTSLLIKEAVK